MRELTRKELWSLAYGVAWTTWTAVEAIAQEIWPREWTDDEVPPHFPTREEKAAGHAAEADAFLVEFDRWFSAPLTRTEVRS